MDHARAVLFGPASGILAGLLCLSVDGLLLRWTILYSLFSLISGWVYTGLGLLALPAFRGDEVTLLATILVPVVLTVVYPKLEVRWF